MKNEEHKKTEPIPENREEKAEKKKRGNVANLIPFVKGKSGNPKGRTPGKRNLSSLLKEALMKLAVNPKTGEKILVDGKQMTYQDLLVQQVLVKGIVKGNDKTIELIFDRLEGKPRQKIDFNDESEDREDRFSDIRKLVSILTHGESTSEEKDNSEETV